MDNPNNKTAHPSIQEALSNIDIPAHIGDTIYHLNNAHISKTFVDNVIITYELYDINMEDSIPVSVNGETLYLLVEIAIRFADGRTTDTVNVWAKDRDIFAKKVLEFINQL